MEITEIRKQLNILEVVAHYGLKPDKNNRLLCPFHADKTPSLQLYPKTNTYCCFSTNCQAGTGDGIDFIQKKEGASKHAAIMKAKQLLGYQANPTKALMKKELLIALLYDYFKKGIGSSKPAQSYLEERGLYFRGLDVGYNAGSFHQSNPNWIAAAVAYGMLSQEKGYVNTRTGEKLYQVFAKACLVFPLRDSKQNPVGLYFRSIKEKKGANHYYLKDRKGLYPCYPKENSKSLILTESVIDAATIQANFTTPVLALYGTNGFSKEHEVAIKGLKELEEVTLFFDGDEAGRAAISKIAAKLKTINENLEVTAVSTPEGEDVNSLIQSHEVEVLQHLLQESKPVESISFSSEKSNEKEIPEPEETPQVQEPKQQQPESKLITKDPYNLVYATQTAHYSIKGGLNKDYSSLKVTLFIQKGLRLKYRTKTDLYEHKNLAKTAQEAATILQVEPEQLLEDLYTFTDLLETYREQKKTAHQSIKSSSSSISQGSLEKCKEFGKQPDLMKAFNELIGKSGIVGEETNRLFMFVCAVSHQMPHPLHLVVQGSSGSGKSHLIGRIGDLMPQQKVKRFTRVSDKSFYNYGEFDLVNFLIILEDYDGMSEEAELAWRELQSNSQLVSSITQKDERTGEMQTGEKIVRGPIGSIVATTKGDMYQDNESRVFFIAIDESKQQTYRIIDYKNRLAGGEINRKEQEQSKVFLQNYIRSLKPLAVKNPWLNKIKLPVNHQQLRRLHSLFEAFCEQITLLHQHQREKTNQGSIISQKEDIKLAIDLLFESIILKADELDGQLRSFYEDLKNYVLQHDQDQQQSFIQREVRQALRISKTQLHRYIQELLDLEYIQKKGFGKNGAFLYKISYWDDNAKLRAKIRESLNKQLEEL